MSAGPRVHEAALLAQARRAQAAAYAPYSRLRVGCALQTADGRIFSGANVESAAYPAGLCAERAALGAAVAAGAREFAALVLVADGPGPCPPCGVCRQALVEFAPDLPVVAAGADGALGRYVLGRDLLPDAFDASRLPGRPGAPPPPG
ncbi:MAG TPA: cytidine deaminase [Egibacteraceae bacterium]|nr:cytidine deaminase [Egibacteraceae bacterium]